MKKKDQLNNPDKISSYFYFQWRVLVIISVTGIIYNVGMTAGPWFEGKLAQMLCDIINGSMALSDMIVLASQYIAVIVFVQLMRYAKRFYVRRFANNVRLRMKHVLYRNLIHKSKPETDREDIGSVMTKAVSDIDACAEGMRKFTTEIFDTGIVMISYIIMLVIYDWRLALISCVFPSASYFIANRLKRKITLSASEYKESAGRLNTRTLDRVSGTLTYRILGQEPYMDAVYENDLRDYEKKAVRAGILETALQPLYQIISMISVIFIVFFGIKNIQGNGWSVWDIAAFTTFLSCFAKLAVKSSKCAKLFNAVGKAKVSWDRIKPLMKFIPDDEDEKISPAGMLTVENLSFSYDNKENILSDICFTAEPGQIIGVTGSIACGKSTLGKVFLCENDYCGNIYFNGHELRDMSCPERCGTVAYSGHDTELMSDSVKENVSLGNADDVMDFIKAVCIDEEVSKMPHGIDTMIGSGGICLSGGQQARIALARTLFNKKPLIILDDPFSALDRTTEKCVMKNLRDMTHDCIVILISHRLYLFPEFEKVLWMENGHVTESTHNKLMETNDEYRRMYMMQTGDKNNEEQNK